MRFEVTTPARAAIVRRGIPVEIAPRGTSWSELPLGVARSSIGVYIIHHGGVVKYVGKTSGPKMDFGTRLRRHFQESAAGDHTYPRLNIIETPPQIQVSLYGSEEILRFVSFKGKGVFSDRGVIIQLFEAAIIIAVRPEFQRSDE